MKKLLSSLLLSFIASINPLLSSEGISLAKEYQNNSNFQWNSALESLNKIFLSPSDKVLDVGCGNGKITAYIANQVPNGIVVGLDISKDMLTFANTTFSSNNIIYMSGNAKNLPFEKQFDKVVSFNTIHWVVEQKQALQSLVEALKPGGTLLLVTPGKTESNLGTRAEKLIQTDKWSPYFPTYKQERIYFTSEEYLELLSELPLKLISFEASETTTPYKDIETLKGHVRPLLNFIDHLSPELKEDFLNDFIGERTTYEVKTLKLEVIAEKL